MIGASLTAERVALPDGTTAYPYEWHGETVPVVDNALNALRVLELFADEGPTEHEKAEEIVNRIFAEPGKAFAVCSFDYAELGELVKAVVWDVFGLDAGTGERADEDLLDFEEDAAALRVSFRQAYGIDWDESRGRIAWGELLELVRSMPPDTPVGRRLYYRDGRNRPKPDRHNKEAVARFDRLHKHYALEKARKSSPANDIERQAKAMDDMGLAMIRKAGERKWQTRG